MTVSTASVQTVGTFQNVRRIISQPPREMKNYVIGVKNGRCVVASEKEIIENALQQEKDGVKPHYSFYDYKKGEKATPAGWLVWSSISYGCGVVYRRNDGKMIISTGIQGDFCYC